MRIFNICSTCLYKPHSRENFHRWCWVKVPDYIPQEQSTIFKESVNKRSKEYNKCDFFIKKLR